MGMRRLELHRAEGSLAHQAADKLRSALGRGLFLPGDKLPSEPELARIMQVSRSTLRAALHTLELEGIILRRPGLGTFVSELPLLEYNLSQLLDLSVLIRSLGHKPSLQVLDVGVTAADAQVAQKLAIQFNAAVVRTERLHTADGKPVVYHLEFFPREFLDRASPPLDVEELAPLLNGDRTFFEVFLDATGQRITGAVTSLKPTLAGGRMTEILQLPAGSPLMRFEQIDHNRDHEPVQVSFEYHVPELCTFLVHRKVASGSLGN